MVPWQLPGSEAAVLAPDRVVNVGLPDHLPYSSPGRRTQPVATVIVTTPDVENPLSIRRDAGIGTRPTTSADGRVTQSLAEVGPASDRLKSPKSIVGDASGGNDVPTRASGSQLCPATSCQSVTGSSAPASAANVGPGTSLDMGPAAQGDTPAVGSACLRHDVASEAVEMPLPLLFSDEQVCNAI